MLFAARKLLASTVIFLLVAGSLPSASAQTNKREPQAKKPVAKTTTGKQRSTPKTKADAPKKGSSAKNPGKSEAPKGQDRKDKKKSEPKTDSSKSSANKKGKESPKGPQEKAKPRTKGEESGASASRGNSKAKGKAKGKTGSEANEDQAKDSGTEKKKGRSKGRKSAAERRAEAAEKRKREREERERRARLAREAEERRRTFERGLREETAANIAKDNLEGEDPEIRRVAVEALGGKAGTAVVMDPRTGRIHSIVNQDWALKRGFKPCSTIKLVSGIAAINENLVGADGVLNDKSFPMNLDDALAYSNNTYFQKAGPNFGRQKMVDYARAFGLGVRTGINMPGETAGRVPTNNDNPRIYSHGDDFEVTPLQLAVMVSAITNGGYLPVPRILTNRFEQASFSPQSRGRIELPSEVIRSVIPGMVGASQYGTARRGIQRHLEVAGKTGSCIGGNTWVGLFASVAPIDDPKFAVVVITQGDSERGRHAAEIAGRIFKGLEDRMPVGSRPNIASIPKELQPQRRINTTQSTRYDNETNEAGPSRTINTGSVRPASSAEELFPPIVITSGNSSTRPRVVGQN